MERRRAVDPLARLRLDAERVPEDDRVPLARVVRREAGAFVVLAVDPDALAVDRDRAVVARRAVAREAAPSTRDTRETTSRRSAAMSSRRASMCALVAASDTALCSFAPSFLVSFLAMLPTVPATGGRPDQPDTVGAMPIHLRAQPGDYAEAVLLPGDPLRARYIAETFFEDVREVNGERGMLGFSGTYEGRPISVQASGMGCPSAAIVVEELVQLGVKRVVRVGTCGGLQPDMALGDLVVAVAATAADGTVSTYTGGEPYSPTADFEVVHAAVHEAKHRGQAVRVGSVVSSDVFYNPDTGIAQRWSDRGILAVEMEAAVLFTVAAMRRISAGCLLTVSDVVVEGEFVRISDEELRAAVDRMTELGIRAALAESRDATAA